MAVVELRRGQSLEDVADPGGSSGFFLVDHADEWEHIRTAVKNLASSQQWAICSACLDHWQQGERFGIEHLFGTAAEHEYQVCTYTLD